MKKNLRLAAIVATFIGLAVSMYLAWTKISNQDVLCFEGMGDCNIVNASAYSMWRGIPIAFIGIIGYLFILLFLFLFSIPKVPSSGIILALFIFSSFGTIYSVYLTYVQFFIIHAFCPWCLMSALMMVTIFIISTIMLIKEYYR
ncbi:MAG: vitamin K epoxide reductase family protein [Anaerolineaceae bacterium]|nr:vitamin K epoxide reductase family protein [Anaerolineaceae bacterium]MBN2678545.1 vitamin K epoxide reductase family protein [Anaerolineaceae bacterium]